MCVHVNLLISPLFAPEAAIYKCPHALMDNENIVLNLTKAFPYHQIVKYTLPVSVHVTSCTAWSLDSLQVQNLQHLICIKFLCF